MPYWLWSVSRGGNSDRIEPTSASRAQAGRPLVRGGLAVHHAVMSNTTLRQPDVSTGPEAA